MCNFCYLQLTLILTDKRQCQILRKIKIKRKNKSKSIIPKGFFLSLHFSLNSRIIFFISSSTAALEGAHTRTRFCLILALKFSSEWPFRWFYNLSYRRQTTMRSSLGIQIFVCLQILTMVKVKLYSSHNMKVLWYGIQGHSTALMRISKTLDFNPSTRETNKQKQAEAKRWWWCSL